MKKISGVVSLNKFDSDGDTVPFRADNLNDWSGLTIRPTPSVTNPWVRVRLDACDAPELHYESLTQSTVFGRAAAEMTYQHLGGGFVDWSLVGNRPTNSEEIPVVLEVVGVDQFKRVIGWLYPPGVATSPENSANYALLNWGLAYPAIYTTTPATHAPAARDAWASARTNARGFAPLDTTASFRFSEMAVDQSAAMILPKIWRRVALFASQNPDTTGLKAWMKSKRDLALPVTGTVLDIRKNMSVTGDDVTVTEALITATWVPARSFTSSQIFAWLH